MGVKELTIEKLFVKRCRCCFLAVVDLEEVEKADHLERFDGVRRRLHQFDAATLLAGGALGTHQEHRFRWNR